MSVLKCKMCGGDLQIPEGATTATCEYCGIVQTIPKADDEKKLLQFERAERLRKQCEFDKAAGIYESIVADFRDEAEAYWGLVLCKYGIEYVDDPATGRKVPTCHRSGYDSVFKDVDFDQAQENAEPMARRIYREEAKQIEELRKNIISVSANEEPYDIFICYKETDLNGNRTLDSVLAQDIYDTLTGKGYRVFFSRISLEDKLGQAYEPYIFAAMHSAKIMLAVGTSYEHYNAVWVKNEWSRFLKLMAVDKSKSLIPCYKNIDAYDMPEEFAHLQAQDLGKVGALQDLLRGIEKITQSESISPEPIPKEPPQRATIRTSQNLMYIWAILILIISGIGAYPQVPYTPFLGGMLEVLFLSSPALLPCFFVLRTSTKGSRPSKLLIFLSIAGAVITIGAMFTIFELPEIKPSDPEIGEAAVINSILSALTALIAKKRA